MVQRACAVMLVAVMGCATIINSDNATVTLPPGASVNGGTGTMVLSQQRSHEVIYPDGRRCILESRVGAGYVIADVILTFLLGIIVDAATGKWRSLDADTCPGVIVD